MDEQKTGKIGLAFLGYLSSSEGQSLRGGMLVTDEVGKPLEFRCTSPVRPTQIQRMLYGKSLIPHVTIDLMGVPLLRTLREKPVAIFVRDPVLLDLRTKINLPVVHLRRQGESFSLSPEEKGTVTAKPLVVECSSGRFEAVVATSHRNYVPELESLRESLSVVFANLDLLEPFERVTKALQEIERQKAFER